MAQIGQIVYNLEDYNSSGGFISTSKTDPSITTTDPADMVDIYGQNLVEFYRKGASFTKVGIQAPPGTKFYAGGSESSSKVIMVGRTGIYELDDEIIINYLRFVTPKKYILDEVNTNQELNLGISEINAAEKYRADELDKLNAEYEDREKDIEYWNRYSQIQSIYLNGDTTILPPLAGYNEGLSHYRRGVNGVYKQDGTKQLYNIIIDFLYE